MEFIVVADSNWGIGYQGGLLDHLSKDMAFFKATTTNHVVVMGRKTLESFPNKKPLPNRVNIVLTRDCDFVPNGDVILVHSISELEATLTRLNREDVFLIGGASLYESLLPYCKGGYVTCLEYAYESVDSYFPNLAKNVDWELAEVLREDEEKGKAFKICYFKNNNPKCLEAYQQ